MFKPILTVTMIFISVAAAAANQPAATPPANAVVGDYRFQSGLIMTIEYAGAGVTVKSTGQPVQSLTASTDGHFSYAAIPAYITFDLDAKGVSKTLNFHYDERSLEAKRIDAATAKRASDALELKIKNQTHDPACEATLKRLVEEARGGKPDYSKMTLTLAQTTRMQLPMLQQRIVALGTIKEVKFTGVAPIGAETFDVAFENGATQWRIFCLPNGFISAVGFR
jgi:hypothetical protein